MEKIQIYIDAAGISDKGLVRQANEDNLAAVDLSCNEKFSGEFEWNRREVKGNGLMLAVADGMGGAQAGEVASRMAVELLGETLAVDSIKRTNKALLGEHIELVNKKVRHTAEKNPNLSGMGSTLTVVLINEDRALIGQVGDSRAYLLRSRRLTRLTKDQSLVQALVDAGTITSEQAEVSPQKNVILSAIGHEGELKPVVGEIELERGDYLLLCSDGLTNMVKEEEISAVLSRSLSLRETCRLLVELAKRRGGDDNITIIVAHIFGLGLPSSDEEVTIMKQFSGELF